MKILAGLLATTLLAAPVFAQGNGSNTPPPTPPAGADQGKPPADNTPPGDASVAAAKPADATPQPDQAPEGTTPVKPADTPSH